MSAKAVVLATPPPKPSRPWRANMRKPNRQPKKKKPTPWSTGRRQAWARTHYELHHGNASPAPEPSEIITTTPGSPARGQSLGINWSAMLAAAHAEATPSPTTQPQPLRATPAPCPSYTDNTDDTPLPQPKPSRPTPNDNLWAEPASSPSYLDDETDPSPRPSRATPNGSLWAEPAPYPSYLDDETDPSPRCTPTTTPTHHRHHDTTDEGTCPAHKPSDLVTPPPY